MDTPFFLMLGASLTSGFDLEEGKNLHDETVALVMMPEGLLRCGSDRRIHQRRTSQDVRISLTRGRTGQDISCDLRPIVGRPQTRRQ